MEKKSLPGQKRPQKTDKADGTPKQRENGPQGCRQ
jgi:hypothetical protein